MTVREHGYDAVMVNCNPETVSTDYDICDRLYFEPLTFEDVANVVANERPKGVIVQFGGQTPLKLAAALVDAGVPLLGTSHTSIHLAEDRGSFGRLLEDARHPLPALRRRHRMRRRRSRIAEQLGYPLLVRPSFVLGGRAMQIVYDAEELAALHGDRGQRQPRSPGAHRQVPRRRDRGRRRRRERWRRGLHRRRHAARRGGRRALRRLDVA